ncbi:hypothetical protein SASPL_126993 [Salvia splendens]|uniref:CCHC-type domain-containing protein n=1 Tax=Salvia splendens TaxID=180675 RepID=A0A8X8XLI1_SALSN|nr:hypothetical protein SASPL_126993 [Salvia splendens]
MHAFLEGEDLWEAVEDDYEVPPLGVNSIIAQIKVNKERVKRKAKARSSLYVTVNHASRFSYEYLRVRDGERKMLRTSEFEPRRPEVKCRKCEKMGHIERICKGNNSAQGEAQAAAEEMEQLFVASCHVTGTTSEGWLVDSQCSDHISGNQAIFNEIGNKYVDISVRIGNGE